MQHNMRELCKSLSYAEEVVSELDGGTGNKKPPRKERKKLTAYSGGGKERFESAEADDVATSEFHLNEQVQLTSSFSMETKRIFFCCCTESGHKAVIEVMMEAIPATMVDLVLINWCVIEPEVETRAPLSIDLPSRSRISAKAPLSINSWSFLVNESSSHLRIRANKCDHQGLTYHHDFRVPSRLLASQPTSKVSYSMESSPILRSIPMSPSNKLQDGALTMDVSRVSPGSTDHSTCAMRPPAKRSKLYALFHH
ncbi:hypothetical protein Acr_24g0002400 [Actinidia rufa]|uniref:Uncharacterized protein n=1 Tax=Actinidia rufa TaxID=165716 RepID=A0A7J0GT98_9ERIC|nr:hypothetical protein Acr_24g0002400 [Actinidia rufa]